jgi:hypothetical protein
MKCIQCETDNNLKDRTAHFGRCSSCNHPFAFEPTTMTTVKVTDPMFKKTIDELSANNTLFFTEKQFAYYLDKRLRRSASVISVATHIISSIFFTVFAGIFIGGFLMPIATRMGLILPIAFFFVTANFVYQAFAISNLHGNSISNNLDSRGRRKNARNLRNIGFWILILDIIASLIIAPSPILFAAAVLLGMRAITWGNERLNMPDISQEFLFAPNVLRDWLKRWESLNSSIVKLLPPPPKQLGTKVNPDVTAYSFDRLVVCQSAEVAQMLINNNFHFENNCAILSIDGYPQDIFDIAMQMLRRNLDLKVYVLHDCSPQGMGVLRQLKTSDRWFRDSTVTIIDIGLTPHQVMSTNGLFIQTSSASAQVAKQIAPSDWTGLTLDEVAWLEEGNYVELESFTPQQLIRVLNHGIAGTRNLLGVYGYTSIGGSDGYMYTSESFG